MRQSMRVSMQGGEDDDFNLQALGIADGFRPHHMETPMPPLAQQSSASSSTLTPPSIDGPPTPPRPVSANRSSIAKPRTHHDSFSVRHDGPLGHTNNAIGLSRVSSVSTDSPVVHNDRPYDGPSGPSHPYQMYPQNIRVARSLSVATSSTAPPPPETSYSGPNGPTHPYAMYPQNPIAESSSAPASNIPIGFSGVPDSYQRRIGAEGEEIADIIGPDGHTEQLPPYTRYPDETYARKVRDAEVPEQTPVVALQTIPGAGGIGLAPRNPEFDSADDLNSPQSRNSLRSFSSNASHHDINMAAAEGISEKRSWQKRAGKKAFGVVPYWAICLTVTALLLMGIILGAVIGSFFGKHKKPDHRGADQSQPETAPTVTVTYDATPIPTPTNLPDLPTGTFSLPLGLNKSPALCFNDTTESMAWSCSLIFGGYGSGMTISITKNAPQLGKPGNYDISINSNQSLTVSNNVYSYGAQPPLIPTAMPMELVNDTFEPGRGPAWFRMLPYNKTVVLPESVLSAPQASQTSSSDKKRGFGGPGFPGPGDFKRKGVAQQGDKPWICSWPDTFIEVFIYAMQNTSFSNIKPSGGSSTITSSLTSTPTMSYTPTWPPPSGPPPTDSPMPTSGFPDGWVPPPPAYPKVVKVEERRISFSRTPVCRQVEILQNGQIRPVLDEDDNPIEFEIAETEPGPVTDFRLARRNWSNDRSILPRDGADMSNCGCMWSST